MTRVLYLHDFLIYFLSVYEKWPQICVPPPWISVLHLGKEGVEWETQLLRLSCRRLVWWFVVFLHRRREASETQSSKEGVWPAPSPRPPPGPSAQEEARCNRSFCWTQSFVIETCISWNWNFILFLNFYLFFKLKKWGFLAVLGLCCHTWTFSSYSERGLLLAVHGLLTGVASLVAEDEL